MTGGLNIIGGRAESLARVLDAYAKLARLPRPVLAPVQVADWLRRGARLDAASPSPSIPANSNKSSSTSFAMPPPWILIPGKLL